MVAMTVLALLALPDGDEIPFKHRVVDRDAPVDMHTKTVGDLNGDGLTDLVVAGTRGLLVWYESPNWKRHVVAREGGGWSCDAEVGDVNGDGRKDIVVSDWYQKNRMVWFENPAAGEPWKLHPIGGPRAHDIELGDLDGDGDLDVVTRQQGGNGKTIEIWTQEGADRWRRDTLRCPVGEGLHLGDLDKDGDPDILLAGRWYENTGKGKGEGWTEHVYAAGWTHGATLVWMADVDGDGRPDLVLTPSEGKGGFLRTSWYAAPEDPRAGDWKEHVIDPRIETVTHTIAVADMDNDGDQDVFTAEMHQGADPDEVRIYLNLDGKGTKWRKQVVSTSGSHCARLADLDNDGDVDIFGANWSRSGQVDLWENMIK